jgi:hypothetical protein
MAQPTHLQARESGYLVMQEFVILGYMEKDTCFNERSGCMKAQSRLTTHTPQK